MKQFLAIYTGSPTSANRKTWDALDDAGRNQRQAQGMKAWMEWIGKNKDAIVVQGGPLGKTKLIDPKGVSDIKNNMAAYVVVQAESHEAAAKMFLNHPHFAIFPGDSVEIMECLPIPGQ
jgi:hypothetical protein